jgi:hypothetical protein
MRMIGWLIATASLLPEVALAQTFATDWDGVKVFDGVAEETMPVSMAMKQWNSTGDVFLLTEIRRQEEGDVEKDLLMSHKTCSLGDGCATVSDISDDTLSTVYLNNTQLLPSMAVTQVAGERQLHVVRKHRVDGDCDDDLTLYYNEIGDDTDVEAADLSEEVWSTDGGWVSQYDVKTITDTSCDRFGTSYTKYVPSTKAVSCFTWDAERGTAGKCTVYCGQRLVSGSGSWSNTAVDGGGNHNDHAVWTYLGDAGPVDSHMAIVHRDDLTNIDVDFVEADITAVDTVRFPLSVAPDPVMDVGDYPWIVRNANSTLFSTWHEKPATGNSHLARFIGCTTDDFCDDISHWSGDGTGVPQTIWEQNHLQHVEIAVEGTRQFVIFSADSAAAGAKQMRVYFTWRCEVTDSWEEPVAIFTPATAAWDSMLDFGRPHLVLNRSDDMIHVAFWEQSTDGDSATDGNAWWAYRSYPSCT